MNRIIGVESCNAVCTPIAALLAPGPRVTKQMPGRPLSLPCASAMKAAPPSCRQAMKRMRCACWWNPSSTARKLSPGTPNTVSTPWATRASTRAWPAIRCVMVVLRCKQAGLSAGGRGDPTGRRAGSVPARIVSVREWRRATPRCQPAASSDRPCNSEPDGRSASASSATNDTFGCSDIRVHRNRRASLRPPRLACRARLGPAKRWLSCGERQPC